MSIPDSKYMMLWGGEWRAVVTLLDAANHETTSTIRAAKAVLYIDDDHWGAIAVSPADLIERTDRNPNAREWDYID